LTSTFEDRLAADDAPTGLLDVYRWLLERLDESRPIREKSAKVDVELVLSALRELQERESNALGAFVRK